jgi:hypothetical protein
MADLATVLREQEKLEEAEEQCHRVVAACRRALGEEHTQTRRARLQLGGVLLHEGKFVDADTTLSGILPGLRRGHGESSRDTLVCKYRLGHVRIALDRLEEGEALIREALEGFISTEGPGIMPAFGGFLHWSDAFLSSEQRTRARPFLQKVVDHLRREVGEEDAATRLAILLLALAEQEPPCGAETETLLRDYSTLIQDELAAGDTQVAVARSCRGHCLTQQGRFEEAESLLIESFHTIADRRGERDALTRVALRRIVHLYSQWNRPQQVAEWKARLDLVPQREHPTPESPAGYWDYRPVTELLPPK